MRISVTYTFRVGEKNSLKVKPRQAETSVRFLLHHSESHQRTWTLAHQFFLDVQSFIQF